MISQQEYAQRRTRLLQQLQPNSIAVISAAKTVTRSRDTHFAFRQNSDFEYLCGFPEPDALLVLSNQQPLSSILFCLPKDAEAEIWHGRRVGVEQAIQQYGMDEAYSLDDCPLALPELLNGHSHVYFAQGEQADIDEQVFDSLQQLRNAPKQSKSPPRSMVDIRPLLHSMRMYKSSAEIAALQQAADISVSAHQRAMQAARAGVFEYQLQAEMEHEFAMQGARAAAYGSIVGGGDNACILHYTENSDVLREGELVLIDAGAEYRGYAADITRTFPVSGRFSEPQRQLYQIVLKAQLAAIGRVKPGSNLTTVAEEAVQVLVQGLVELGILKGTVQENLQDKCYREFYMHGIGHWLGLDVHDVGHYKVDGRDVPFEPGMVMTIEPGLYIAADADVDAQWRGIGIRIEDNLLVTVDGHRNLTQALPKTIEQIEAFMQQEQQPR